MAAIRAKNKLGQYFTPSQICDFMVGLSSKPRESSVLEPSSGTGAFLDALHSAGFEDVIGVEIDSEIAGHSSYPVENSSFISWQSKKKFDLVIGNPPYIRWRDLADQQKMELRAHPMFGTLVNSLGDYLLPFIALSIEKLELDGELIFITPSFWLQTKHSKPLRDYLSDHGAITDLVDFGETPIFKDVATALVIFKFVRGNTDRPTTLHRFIGGKLPRSGLSLSDSSLFRSEELSNFRTNGKFVAAFDDEVRDPIVLEENCRIDPTALEIPGPVTSLGHVVKIANGLVTGLDSAFRLSPEQFELIPDEEKDGVSRVLKGRNLQRLYSPAFSHYIDIDPTLSDIEVEKRFPTLLRLLEPRKDELLARYVNGSELKWWQWSFYRSANFHRSPEPKIFVPGKERLTVREHVRFSLAPEGVIATQDVTAFAPLPHTREHVNYIVAFLSLDSVTAWIKTFGLMKGGVAEFSEKPLSEVPFRKINWGDPSEVEAHNRITAVVGEAISHELDADSLGTRISAEFEALLPGLIRK